MATYRVKLATSVSAKEDVSSERIRKLHKPSLIESINIDFRESTQIWWFIFKTNVFVQFSIFFVSNNMNTKNNFTLQKGIKIRFERMFEIFWHVLKCFFISDYTLNSLCIAVNEWYILTISCYFMHKMVRKIPGILKKSSFPQNSQTVTRWRSWRM